MPPRLAFRAIVPLMSLRTEVFARGIRFPEFSGLVETNRLPELLVCPVCGVALRETEPVMSITFACPYRSGEHDPGKPSRLACVYRHSTQRLELRMPTRLESVPAIIDHLNQWLGDNHPWTRSQETRRRVALEEALTNALIHGNLEISSRLREADDDSYARLIALRLRQVPYRHRRIDLIAAVTAAELRITIRDNGPGFSVASVPDPTTSECLLRPHGRGITLMRAMMDDVFYSLNGTEVTLIKRA